MTGLSALNSAKRIRINKEGIMQVRIICFTDRGLALGNKIAESIPQHRTEIVTKGTPLSLICSAAFMNREALCFIGAMGIAVRSIAPYLKDKLTDPPVIVIDESGRHVIPVLSGHVGGANELSCDIAAAIGAEPVLTTATDVSRAFSADLFAGENSLRIVNRDGIAKVASSSLEGKPVTICIKDYPPQDHVSVLITDDCGNAPAETWKNLADIVLCPRKYAVGIGCRKGKSFEEIRDFAEEVLSMHGIDPADIGAIATIDIKKEEAGLIRLSEYWRVPLITFDSSVLAKVEGEFDSSERVMAAVGVDNVCERSAAAAAGINYKLVVKKTAQNGMTIAVAARKQ